MPGMKYDATKPASYLIAHDVVIHDTEPGQGIEFYAARLRSWWNRAGTLPALQLGSADYFGLVKVLEFGAAKYAPRNWESGIAYHRVFRAAMDHYARRGDNDPETGLPHRYHFLCCYMFLAAYTARGLHEFDDRPGVGPYALRAAAVEPEEEGPFGVFWREDLPGLGGTQSICLPEDYPTRDAAQAAIREREDAKLVDIGDYVVRPL